MHGLIQISEPIVYKKNQRISIKGDQVKLICILDGSMQSGERVFMSGDVYGLENLIEENETTQLIALEETRLIAIESEDIEFLKKERQNIVTNILSSTVNYITEMKDHLN